MDKKVLLFTVSKQDIAMEQTALVASDTVAWIQSIFNLDDNWKSMDRVSAIWSNGPEVIETVLDADGACVVPPEVKTRKGNVKVNLVGSVMEDGELVERLTTYPIIAIIVDAKVRLEGSETQPVTPSQFEQYIAIVSDLVDSVKDIDEIVLNDDYTLTIKYSDGTSYTTTSIRGEQGEPGAQGPQGPQGEPGPQGPPGEVDAETLQRILPTDSASGAIASFPDGSDLVPMQSLTVSIEPKQSGSGTPSPDNVRPISGWDEVEAVVCGKNVWGGEKLADDIVDTVPNSTKDTVNKTVKFFAADVSTRTLISGIFKENTRYTFICKDGGTSNGINIKWLYSDGTDSYIPNFTSGVSVSSSVSGKTVVALVGVWSSGYTDIKYEESGVFEGVVTADDFAPYQATTHTTPLPSTVYGGTLDLVSGVLTVTKKLTTITSFSGTFGQRTNGYCVYAGLGDRRDSLDSISNIFVLSTLSVDQMPLGTYQGGSGGYTTWSFILPSTITSLEEANAWLANLPEPLVVTEHITPTTTQLTGQEIAVLLGTNNVWSDCGDTRVVYSADIQKYIDKKLQ